MIASRYRIAVGDKIFDAAEGARITVPLDSPWRNATQVESRLLAITTPGGFKQIAYQAKDTPPDQFYELAARFGCEILGPPVA